MNDDFNGNLTVGALTYQMIEDAMQDFRDSMNRPHPYHPRLFFLDPVYQAFTAPQVEPPIELPPIDFSARKKR